VTTRPKRSEAFSFGSFAPQQRICSSFRAPDQIEAEIRLEALLLEIQVHQR